MPTTRADAASRRSSRPSRFKAGPIFLVSSAVAILFTLFALGFYADDAVTAHDSEPSPRGDFAFLLGAGHLIVSSDRQLLYDYAPNGPNAWQRDHGYMFPTWYPYPPSVALLTSPLTALDLGTAMSVWRYLVVASGFALGICVASAFKGWAWRIAMVVSISVWFPLLMNVRIGQTGAFVALATALFILVYLQNRERGALALGLLALKPTAAIGPALIILQERPAIWMRFAAVGLAVVPIPFAVLGPYAFLNWTDILRGRTWVDIGGGHSYNQGLSSLIGLSSDVGLVIAIFLCILAAGFVHLVQMKLGLHAAMAFAILAGCLVNPHSLFYDWGTAFVAIMLLRMSDLIPRTDSDKSDLVFGVLALTLFFCGQFAWDARHEEGHYLRPLTAWTLFVVGTLFLLTLRRFTEPDAPDESKPALATASPS